MVKSTDDSGPPLAPFLKKCYEMVEDASTDPTISWGVNGDTFVIWDMTQFSIQLLPKYFKHSNFSSFMRQLNIYGFRKVDTDRWEFVNDGFIKGQKHLLKSICRRKHSQAADQKKLLPLPDNTAGQADKADNDTVLLKEVENLKQDKNALMQEFINLRKLQETSENKLVLLRDRLQGMEENQQHMLSLLGMAMQNPGILMQLLQPKENNWRMAEIGEEEESINGGQTQIVSGGTIVRYQPAVSNPLEHGISPASGLGQTIESNNQPFDGAKDAFLSIEFMKKLMDEKFSLDSHGPFILPDAPDDGAWKELLLAYPFVEKSEENKQDNLANSDSFELFMRQMEKSGNVVENDCEFDEADSDDGENMDHLTMQMEHLASESYGTY